MRRWLGVVLLCLAASCSPRGGADDAAGAVDHGAAAPPAAQTGPDGAHAIPDQAGHAGGVMRFEPAVVLDATGFERPMGAASLFIPHGWHAQGGVLWGADYMCTNGFAFNWQAASPDGSALIAILPQERWETSNYGAQPSTPGCQPAPFTNTRTYLENLAQRWRPGARIVDYRARPDLQAEFSAANKTVPMPAGEIRTWADAGEILFDFDDRGRAMRGTLAAVVIFTLTRTDYGMGPMEALIGDAQPVWGAAAPSGRLDVAYFEALRRSIKTNPDWLRRIGGHNMAIARVSIEESRKRADMIQRSNAEIARIRDETWAAYQDSADRRARDFGELMRGVETYQDDGAPGGQVELSHMYDRAWRLQDGSYVLSNDPSFDPWRDLKIEGQELKPVR